MSVADPPLSLVPLSGPAAGAHAFTVPTDHPASIGRAAACDISLLDDAVSRRHATITRRRNVWFVIDEDSSGGTYLNGVRLPNSRPAPLLTSDLLRIGPFTFRVVIGDAPVASPSTFDEGPVKVQRAAPDRGVRGERRLVVLSDCIARLNHCTSEPEAARASLASALSGSGYARGAVLRRIPAANGTPAGVDTIATLRADPNDAHPFTFSRSLIEQANSGDTVVLTAGAKAQPVNHGQSIADLEIHSALCVPIEQDGSVTGYLYFDARGRESLVKADATAFCESIGIAFGLSVANIQRAQLERRQTDLHAELAAAREVQQLMMPPVTGSVGAVCYAARSMPGSFVAGDLFDVVNIAGSGVAVCLGDVSGHGAGSAMLMAAAQAFLSAELRRLAPGDGPGAAVSSLNSYLCERPLAGRFLSLWVGVLNPDGTLVYVDAGHGHWVHIQGNGDAVLTPDRAHAGGIPIGIDPKARYEQGTLKIRKGERVLIYSDGIIEQRGERGQDFGLARLHSAVSGGENPRDDVGRIFAALDAFMTSPMLDDDATAASIGLC